MSKAKPEADAATNYAVDERKAIMAEGSGLEIVVCPQYPVVFQDEKDGK